MRLVRKFVGNRAFYRMVLAVALPVLIQNGITNFVGLLDNIMVGRVGTEQMSGVAIANQLMFVFNICIFGGISGAGIFTAQFNGASDVRGVRDTFRCKLLICAFFTTLALLLFSLLDRPIISLFLHDSDSEGDLLATLRYGRQYLHIMLIGLIPFALMQAYAGTLRETGETLLPMKASVAAVLINLVLNWVLIYGKLGVRPLGVRGAAIATVVSRYVELLIVMLWTHRHPDKAPFIRGAYRSLRIPRHLVGQIIRKGSPLMANELLWSLGMTMMTQCYSLRGLDAIGALNISSTLTNLFNIAYMALGSSISIIVGNQLGAGDMKRARDYDNKLIALSVTSCLVFGVVLAAVAPLFTSIYNTTDAVRALAVRFIRISAILMPIFSFNHASYFTLRSGGKTLTTFLFDSVFVWVISVPAAFLLANYTALPIVPLYGICQSLDMLKSVFGFVLVKRGNWLSNIVVKSET